MIKAALAGIGSVTWSVAAFSAATIAVQAAIQPVPMDTTAGAAASASQVTATSPAIVRLTDGPGAGQLTIQLDRPFADARIEQISNQLGTEIIGSFPSFGTYVVQRPSISVEVTGPNSAAIQFPKFVGWSQISSYITTNGLTLVPGRYRPDDGGWYVNVTLPKISVQPIDAYAGLWQVQLPGHPALEQVKIWATSKGFTVVSFNQGTGIATLRGHAVPRPYLTTAQIMALLRKLIPAQTTQTLPPLAAVTGLAVQPGTGKLTWSAAQNASVYAVWRSSSVTGPWVLVARVSNAVRPLAFTDTTAPVGTSFYRVTSLRRCPTGIGLDCDTQSPLTMDAARSSGIVLATIAAATTGTGSSTTTGDQTQTGSGSTTDTSGSGTS
ncbi:MAG: hypothetical protein DMD58_07525, partial [Gemmatimonadetes bacterium]